MLLTDDRCRPERVHSCNTRLRRGQDNIKKTQLPNLCGYSFPNSLRRLHTAESVSTKTGWAILQKLLEVWDSVCPRLKKRRLSKYSHLIMEKQLNFVPVGVKMFGAFGPQAAQFVDDVVDFHSAKSLSGCRWRSCKKWPSGSCQPSKQRTKGTGLRVKQAKTVFFPACLFSRIITFLLEQLFFLAIEVFSPPLFIPIVLYFLRFMPAGLRLAPPSAWEEAQKNATIKKKPANKKWPGVKGPDVSKQRPSKKPTLTLGAAPAKKKTILNRQKNHQKPWRQFSLCFLW